MKPSDVNARLIRALEAHHNADTPKYRRARTALSSALSEIPEDATPAEVERLRAAALDAFEKAMRR